VRGRSRRDILGHHARIGTPVLSPPWQLVLILTQRDIRMNDLKRRCAGPLSRGDAIAAKQLSETVRLPRIG